MLKLKEERIIHFQGTFILEVISENLFSYCLSLPSTFACKMLIFIDVLHEVEHNVVYYILFISKIIGQ